MPKSSWVRASGRLAVVAFLLCLPNVIRIAAASTHLEQTSRSSRSPSPAPNTDDTSARRAKDLIKDGRYDKAAALARDILAEEEARSGPDSLLVADILDIVVEAERLA